MECEVTISGYLKEHPIRGIKALREQFDWGLYEAKTCFDEIREYGKVMNLYDHQARVLRAIGFIVDPVGSMKLTKPVTVYIDPASLDYKKIEAIKKLRNALGIGLKESKDMMDIMWNDNAPVTIPRWFVNDKAIGALREHGFTVNGYVLEWFENNEDLFTI